MPFYRTEDKKFQMSDVERIIHFWRRGAEAVWRCLKNKSSLFASSVVKIACAVVRGILPRSAEFVISAILDPTLI